METRCRESNMELLRIIAMLMITLHHFLINKYRGGIVNGDEFLSGWQWAVMINGFVYIGVNVFVLISGHFGIKFKWKGVLNLFIICVFYMMLNLITQKYYGADYSYTEILVKSLKAITRTTKWFIPCYLALYFLSPFLNIAKDNMSKQQYVYALLVLSAYCIWFGYIRQCNVFNQTGYSVGQFIWLYFIGGYIRRFNRVNNICKYRIVCVCIWIVMSALWGGATVVLYSGISLPLWHPITYNNPFTLVGAVAFFCLFTTFHFKSRIVNYIARSVLAVYLFEAALPPLINWIGEINATEGILYFTLALAWTLVRFGVAVSVDQVRKLCMIPVDYIWNRTIGKYIQ